MEVRFSIRGSMNPGIGSPQVTTGPVCRRGVYPHRRLRHEIVHDIVHTISVEPVLQSASFDNACF
jgi:hypothetical protein